MNVNSLLVRHGCLDVGGCVFKIKFDYDHNAYVLLE